MFKKKSSKSDLEMEYQCTIRFLDDSEPIQLNFKKDSTGQWLLDQVCQRLNLIEKDYFGLRYVDMERQRHWLDPIKTVYKQLKELIVSAKKNDKVSHDTISVNPMVLCFRVKFYPEDPMSLHEEITRYCLFLQLRRDLHHGRLLCPPSDANLLAAYIIQSELGDYEEQDHPPGYVSQFKMLPKQNLKVEEQIAEIHKTLQKQVPAEAEKNFLRKAASLDTYGIDPHHVKDQKGNPLFLGITHQGIMTFHGNRRTHLFTWSQMKRIVYEGKMFIVHVNTAEDEDIPKKKQQPIGYKCPTTSACKYLWRCAVEQQFFFTLSNSTNVPKVRSGGSLLTRGSRFRFSGRCQTEAVAASGGISRPEPAFTRSSSLPNFNHKRDSKVPLRNMSMTRDAAIKEELPVDVPGKFDQEEHVSPEKMNTSKSAPIASSESSSEEKTLVHDAEAFSGEASPVSVQDALLVPGDIQKTNTPGSESSDVVLAESLNMESVPQMKLSLDEQIKELEQHWVQTQNNSHFSPSQDETSAVSNEKAAATPTSSAKSPSLQDRFYKYKPNMMHVSAVIALLIALVLIVVLASSVQHPIMALIRRQFNLEPMSDYINDKIYRKAGSYGRYQVQIMIHICLNNIPVAFNIMALIFQIHDVPFSCRSLPNNSFVEIGPNKTVHYEGCFVKIFSNETSEETDNKTIPCPNGYQYEQEKYASIRSEWDLVCDDEAFADLIYTMYSIGKLVGCLVLPSLADYYGRKPLIVISNFAMCVLNIIIIFSPSYIFFSVIKGLTGFFQPGLSIPGAVLLLELFPAECRTCTQILHGTAWGVALMLLCPVAYFSEPYGWRCLNAFVALSSCGFLYDIWTLDESLRSLVHTGKLNQAITTIKYMCKVNKINYSEIEPLTTGLDGIKSAKDIQLTPLDEIPSTELSDEIHSIEPSDPVTSETKDRMLQEKHEHHKNSKLPGIIVILMTPCLRKILFIVLYLFFVCSLTYYGLYLMTTRLSGNRFINFFITALFETLSQVLSFTVFPRFPRKICSMACLTFTSVVLIVAVLLRTLSDSDIALMASTGFSFLGTFGISASFLIVWIYVAELFPTDVRNAGTSLSTMAARIGQIIAPFARFLGRLVPWAPGITFGVLCLLTNVLIRFLPETLNTQLPQTVENVKIRNMEEVRERISKKQMKKQRC